MRHTRQLADDPLDERQFELVVRRLASALAYGQESSPFLGAGVEYVQSRLYQPGDAVRSIDWKVTGRTGRPHVKEYEAPRQMPAYLLVDTSASMCVGAHEPTKYAWAVRLAGGLALASLAHMNPVGLLAVGERELHHPPSLSRRTIMQWMHQLRRHAFDEGTSLARRVRELVPRLEQRSLLVVLSDLHDPGATDALRLMAHDHDVTVLHLVDPAEVGLRGAGIFRAVEAETGRAFTAHGRGAWPGTVDPAALARARIDYLRLPVDEPVVPRVRHFFRARGARRRTSM